MAEHKSIVPDEPCSDESGADIFNASVDELAARAAAMRAVDLLRLPALERTRPERRVLLTFESATRGMLWSLSLVIVGLYLLMVSGVVSYIYVPDLSGMDVQTAQDLLDESGLQATVIEELASALPAHQVLAQAPLAGEQLARGDEVSLIVSTGPAGFELPDVIGEELEDARFYLQRLGLDVQIELLQSDEPAGTVLLTLPPAGTRILDDDMNLDVSAYSPADIEADFAGGGQTVMLYVATHVSSAGLREFQLNGLSVAIEPRFNATAVGDVSFDLARRLSSLFEASNAEVTITRTSRERVIAPEEYLARAAHISPQIYIIFSIEHSTDEQEGGIVVRSTDDIEGSTGRLIYERMLANQLDVRFEQANSFGVADDGRNNIHIVLGDTANVDDLDNFAEGFWRDHVARAIYMAVSPQFDLAR